MHVIARPVLLKFAAKHTDATALLDIWYRTMRRKSYWNFHEVKADFPTADVVNSDITIFDIGGNKYQISASIRYTKQRVYIRHVMTHAEYDRRTDRKSTRLNSSHLVI